MDTRARLVVDEIDLAMSNLRDAMVGIPFGRRGFQRQHDQAARDIAYLTLILTDLTAGLPDT